MQIPTSPSLSTTTSISTTTTTSKPTSNTNISLKANKPLNYNYAELFEDVDWKEVNLIDIEKDWREELEQLEKVHTVLLLFWL